MNLLLSLIMALVVNVHAHGHGPKSPEATPPSPPIFVKP